MLAVFKNLPSYFLVILPACVAILPSSAKRDFAYYSLDKVQPALRAVALFALYAFIIRIYPEMSIENIAQKSAADFMQIDETNILIYIVFYMPDLFIQLYTFHTVSIFTVLMVNSYDIHLKS